ncbi:DNA adenine methylase [Alicyclobacillus fodiniaquatilis]|uniref:Site-specific DNA-methyltransferase (adenine-specific) n=1 Tax=Alicyclobacillus fodiniaquatilis TaxID=1661150 RepID=A0ABW4JHJ6_9BACL
MAVDDNQLVQPFLKWAGGKRQLIGEIRTHAPKRFNTYYEPFLGGGAVLFDLQPKKAIVNDINNELVNTYEVIRNHIGLLIEDLKKHKNERAYFYTLRKLDRQPEYQALSPVARASRMIYLNKTCYNGLFRVNGQGQFNVPYGDYKNPNFLDESTLQAVHHFLVSNQIEILNTDFAQAVATAQKGDFVYIDPPYDPVSHTASFTGYSLDGFGQKEQIRLKEIVDDLTRRGCYVLLSNSATNFIKDLYSGYRIVIVEAKRAINSNVSRRGKVDEVLVKNYGEDE